MINYEGGSKVGMSQNVGQRVKVYDKPWCRKPKSCYFFPCDEPARIEQKILIHLQGEIDVENSNLEAMGLKSCKGYYGEYIKSGELDILQIIIGVMSHEGKLSSLFKFNEGFCNG